MPAARTRFARPGAAPSARPLRSPPDAGSRARVLGRSVAALTFSGAILSVGADALAAQIVAQHIEPTGDVPKSLAASLDGILLAELSRREGMSVIAQSDVRALLELESNKQALGCSDTSCLTALAGSLGAELVVGATLSRIGSSWVVALSLIRVEDAQVVRRATGQAKGAQDAAPEAVVSAVVALFADGLPTELQGPAAMTMRGFRAAVAGFGQAVLGTDAAVKAVRRRIILDLVNTELDWDATPKIEALELEIRRGIARLEREMLVTKDGAELERHLRGVEHYLALGQDVGRVKEIRQRSRERGLVPSARPLRFEDPDVRARVVPEDLARYQKSSEPARAVVRRALTAYEKDDLTAFAKLWKQGYQGNAERELKSSRQSDERYHQSYDFLPAHAMGPRLLESALEVAEQGKMLVYLRRYRKGTIYDERRVWLEREGSDWRISSW